MLEGMPAEGAARQALVTGVGLVTPAGRGWEAFRAVANGVLPESSLESGAAIGEPEGAFEHIPVKRGARVGSLTLPERGARATQLALEATREAAHDSGLEGAALAPERRAVAIGCGMGDAGALARAGWASAEGVARRRVGPRFAADVLPNSPAAAVAQTMGMKGPCLSPSSACAAGSHAIAEGKRAIERGEADVVYAGGAEGCLAAVPLLAFSRARALSPGGVARPFDARRDGFLMGEGAAILALESREHFSARRPLQNPHALLAGSGSSCDAHHETAPDPGGDGALRSMEAALDDAGIPPRDVHHVNCHAAGTPVGDAAEVRALAALFGGRGASAPLASSQKGSLGHMLGAGGAAEAALCALALRRGVVLGTPGLREAEGWMEAAEGVAIARESASFPGLRTVLSNSFGFGGTNSSLVLASSPLA